MSIRNEKKIITSRMCPPPNNKQENAFVLTRTNYYSRLKQPQRNPIQHYKKEYTGNNNPNLMIDHKFDIPNQYIVKSTDDCPKCVSNDTLFLTQEIYPNNINCCNLNNTVIRTANTNLSKKYSTTNREYLKNRCKTFNQNLYSKTVDCSRDCNNCNINDKITSTGNVNNAIGANTISSYIFKTGFRDINNNSVNEDGICCSSTITNTNRYNCRPNHFPNITQSKTICEDRARYRAYRNQRRERQEVGLRDNQANRNGERQNRRR